MNKRRSGGNKRRRNGVWFYRYGSVRQVPCCWCKRLLRFRESTLEHLKPVSEGGTEDLNNLDIACMTCNTSRQHWNRTKKVANA